jgi:hypothetical protein
MKQQGVRHPFWRPPRRDTKSAARRAASDGSYVRERRIRLRQPAAASPMLARQWRDLAQMAAR